MAKSAGENYSAVEMAEWFESLEYVLQESGTERATEIINNLKATVQTRGGSFPVSQCTPYCNTIHPSQQPEYPGDLRIEKRIKSYIRWNAMAMVTKAQEGNTKLGGHISSFSSVASAYEVAFNHFFRNKSEDYGGDQVFFQGHTSPGVYSRAYVEGRFDEKHLINFRRELGEGGGLSSYPHPRLMPDFWQGPTVSMGLGPIMAIYQARMMKYMENRGLKPKNGGRIWAFLGDGEMDEPESVSDLAFASREGLDNLCFVVNCNLQRLDGPVRGNGKIIQEIEGIFAGAGWNTIKVVWGHGWDRLLEKDKSGKLLKRMMDMVDGEAQMYSLESGSYVREHFFGKDPELLELVADMTDEELKELRRGGHESEKLYAAYHKAMNETNGKPTVVIIHTVKGYGLGTAGEAKNIAHNQKTLTIDEMKSFRNRFSIPLNDEDVEEAKFIRPPEDSEEMKYMRARREALGGQFPVRKTDFPAIVPPGEDLYEEFYKGSGDKKASTTMVYGRIVSKLLRDKNIGKLLVPIIPDEARTFGMEGLFRQVGIYAPTGQLYEPVDSKSLSYYRESKDGQVLEEGINEAGAMSSFIAAGTAYANHGVPLIPFYTYYSMFGYQRIGDLIWAAGDILCKGFLVGGTAGRTSLNGEGLQHQDGHSHVLMGTVPNVLSYDPAFGFEIAVMIEDGLDRMYVKNEDIFYYITVTNDDTAVMLPMPKDKEYVKAGIKKGIYLFKGSEYKSKSKKKAILFGSGAIMPSVLKAQKLLEDYDIEADVYSVTSYGELRRDGLACNRENMLAPSGKEKVPYITEVLKGKDGVVVASSDYMKLLPDSIKEWIPNTMVSLGTDGFGMSETREALRDHFEVDERWIVLATLTALKKDGVVKAADIKKAMKALDIDVEKRDPMPLV